MNQELKDILLKNAYTSYLNGDVPVGAFIMKDDEVISVGFNTRELNQNVLGHAEINAIKDAQVKIRNWNLSGCDLYVTLMPCSMCLEVIKQCRIDNVYYLLDKPTSKKEFNKTLINKIDDFEFGEEYGKLLSDFFKKLREK